MHEELFRDTMNYCNEKIEELLYLNVSQRKSYEKPESRIKYPYSSFKSRYQSNDPEDLNKILCDCFNLARRYGFVEKKDEKNFIDIFSGKKFSSPVRWLGYIVDLKYFIQGIDGVGIEKLNKDIWNITCKCFIDKNGNSFKKEQFRFTHSPKYSKNLDEIIQLLNDISEY